MQSQSLPARTLVDRHTCMPRRRRQLCRAAVGEKPVQVKRSPAETILQFYAAQNAGDTDGIVELMADNVEYHDMVYADPFQGRAEVADYFVKVKAVVPDYVKFVAEDVAGDERAVGVRWHVEIDGNIFPFSRGVSFYEMDSEGKILKARDVVEGAVKPGTGALQAIGVLAPLIRQLGSKANPEFLPAVAVWAFYAGYVSFVLLSTAAPGVPAYAVTPEDLQSVLNNSLNFFYVQPALCAANISLLPCVTENPVDEALFNFVNAYSLMLGGLMFADPQARGVSNKMPLYIGTMFLTNVFFIPFLGLRAAASAAETEEPEPVEVPAWLPAVGWLAALVGSVSVAWLIAARPEFGGLEGRLDYFASNFQNKRIFFAFVLDALLYSTFQAVLMPKAAGNLRFVPFAGLAIFLIGGAKGYSKESTK